MVTEHILACKEASDTTASGLFSVIVKALKSKNISFEKLVAQTYDGASNMSGFYNGLQAIIKERFGKNILCSLLCSLVKPSSERYCFT